MLPLGANIRAQVHQQYTNWAIQDNLMVQECDIINQKFERLANAKKPTGNPRCLRTVCKAKIISREILKKAGAAAMNGVEDEYEESYGSTVDLAIKTQ